MKKEMGNKGYSLKCLKNGHVKVSVFVGRGKNGNSILKSKTWKPSPDLTAKKNKLDLERFAMEFREQVKQGKILEGENLKFQDFVPKWQGNYAKQNLKESTYECYNIILAQNLIPQFGEQKLSAISPYIVSNYYAELANEGKYKKSTIRKIHAVLSSVMKTAMNWGIINSNPCIRAEIPKINFEIDKEKCFDIPQAQYFISKLDKSFLTPKGNTTKLSTQMQVLFLIAILGGLRRGEILALTWEDIDFKNNYISISKSVCPLKGEVLIKEPKNKRSNRIISIPVEVIDKLKKLQLERKKLFLVLGLTWKNQMPIFIQENGSIMHPSTPRHTLERYITGLNLEVEKDEDKLPQITFHGLRHTHATISIALGNDLGSIAGRIGHSNTNTTLKTYSHFLKEGDERITESLAKGLLKA